MLFDLILANQWDLELGPIVQPTTAILNNMIELYFWYSCHNNYGG